MAERGGFEPPVALLALRRFSKPLLSTTQPPLRFYRTHLSGLWSMSLHYTAALRSTIDYYHFVAGPQPPYRVESPSLILSIGFLLDSPTVFQ